MMNMSTEKSIPAVKSVKFSIPFGLKIPIELRFPMLTAITKPTLFSFNCWK